MAQPTKWHELPKAVADVLGRIEEWRATRTKRTPMPEALWDAATRVAKRHGVWAVARALGVNYEGLRSRCDGPRADGAMPRNGAATKFVELSGAQVIGSATSERTEAGAVLELTSADGATVTVRLPGGSDLDVCALAEAFWRREP